MRDAGAMLFIVTLVLVVLDRSRRLVESKGVEDALLLGRGAITLALLIADGMVCISSRFTMLQGLLALSSVGALIAYWESVLIG